MLYREFLFRIIDLDLLAAQGNVSKLLGQFAVLLVIFSFWILLPAVIASDGPPSEMTLLVTLTTQHLLVATTMLVTGVFAVLSWEAIFPDRRDLMVLSPLPIKARVVFAGKIAAVLSALSVTVFCLDFLPGLIAPFIFSTAPAWPPPQYSSALPPVSARDLKPVLDRDMLAQRESSTGQLSLGKEAGVSIGVVKQGERRIITYGTANPDSIFQIGSISKTFTGLLLARAVTRGEVAYQTPVRRLLPPGTVRKPAGHEISLVDLATQHSGLPRMPDNFHPANRANPYADYHPADLYEYIAKRGVSRSAHPPYLYSNLGFGLLGQALAVHAATSYPRLLKEQITRPLGMPDTVISPSPEQWGRFIQGHSGSGAHNPVHVWQLDALAGAGAISSTAGDMLTYLDAQLHPDKYPVLAPAIEASHRLRAETTTGREISLAWQFNMKEKIFEHGGATAGYTSYAFFCPKGDYAAIVLINTGPNLALPAEQLGTHIRQRLAGEPAVSLAKILVPGRAGVLTTLRAFFAYWITLFAAAAFVLCSVLTVQGLAQLLSRQLFLRLSSVLQLAFFCLFVLGYFLQPPFAGLDVLADQQQRLSWVPSYWFLGLFQSLNGALPPMLAPLARRAWMGLAVSLGGAICAYTICYFRTLTKIAEQPDILPAYRSLQWLPYWGSSMQTAVGQFAIRTLFRSRQHRVILSFYLGISLGLAFFVAKAPFLREEGQQSKSLLVLSFLLMYSAVIGMRSVFSLPLELRANWIFRILPPLQSVECLAATRRALYYFAVLPVLAVIAVLSLSLWPWRAAVAHLLLLGVSAVLGCELALWHLRKIPFTCSFLPGKSYFHLAALVFLAFAFRLNQVAALEQNAFNHPLRYVIVVLIFGIMSALARWRNSARTNTENDFVQFEEKADPVILGLGLNRDGVSAATFAGATTPPS